MTIATNENQNSDNIVAHESGVAMGKEAFDTGKAPEGVVSKTAIAVPVVVTEEAAPVVVQDAPKTDVKTAK